jgi:hypothetical protein
MKILKLALLLFTLCTSLVFCTKDAGDDPGQASAISYVDSVIYPKSQPGGADHIVFPAKSQKGDYSSYPDGLEIDEKTGAINVSESETGLRYRITYRSPSGETSSTVILLAGINYPDKYYRLSQGDSISYPIYNGSTNRSLPVGNFDEGNQAGSQGTAVAGGNGQINLAKTIRNGFFGSSPRNDDQEEIEIAYRLNDNSSRSLQRIKVIIYWYRTMNDVPDYLKEILAARQGMILGSTPAPPSIEGAPTARLSNLARKPRPPCVIVIAQ